MNPLGPWTGLFPQFWNAQLELSDSATGGFLTYGVRSVMVGKASWKPPTMIVNQKQITFPTSLKGLQRLVLSSRTWRKQQWRFLPHPHLLTYWVCTEDRCILESGSRLSQPQSGGDSNCSYHSRCGFFARDSQHIWYLFADQKLFIFSWQGQEYTFTIPVSRLYQFSSPLL